MVPEKIMSPLSFPNAHTISLSYQLAVFMKSHISVFLHCTKSLRCCPCSKVAHSLTEKRGQQDPRNYKREVQEAVNCLPNCVVQITVHSHSDFTEEAEKITCRTWPRRPLQCLPHSLCSWHTSLLATPHTPHTLAHPPLCHALPRTYMAPLPSSFRVLLKCHLITAASSNSLFAPFHA